MYILYELYVGGNSPSAHYHPPHEALHIVHEAGICALKLGPWQHAALKQWMDDELVEKSTDGCLVPVLLTGFDATAHSHQQDQKLMKWCGALRKPQL